MPVDVVHWNPIRRRPGVAGRFLPKRRVNNFGDLIGPVIVRHITQVKKLAEPVDERRLVAVGSIMHFARPGDVVWGAGINGKEMEKPIAENLDVRAVRGPRTREILEDLGLDVPEIYGDPALLWSRFWPRSSYTQGAPESAWHDVTVVPNLHDLGNMRGPHVVSPIGSPASIISKIALSRFVCGSSLHAIILAEAFGIPARLVKASAEPSFKYDDYYAGTGRPNYTPAATVAEAIEVGGEAPLDFNAQKLWDAFPTDLWTDSAASTATPTGVSG